MILKRYKQNKIIRNQIRAAKRAKYLKEREQPLITEKIVKQNKSNLQHHRPDERDNPNDNDKSISVEKKDKISEPAITNDAVIVKDKTINDRVSSENATSNDIIAQKSATRTQNLSIGRTESRVTMRRTYSKIKKE